jgi:hypothetical protein
MYSTRKEVKLQYSSGAWQDDYPKGLERCYRARPAVIQIIVSALFYIYRRSLYDKEIPLPPPPATYSERSVARDEKEEEIFFKVSRPV